MFEKLKRFLAPELYDIGSGGSGAPQPIPEPVVEEKPKKPRKPRKPKPKPVELTAKEKATLAGEPYIAILSVDLDPKDINNGSFELDWNDKFVVNLVKQGYKLSNSDTDAMIVDRWFQTVCRNIALEVYEQEQADPEKRDSDLRIIQQRDLGDGYTEVS
jgi:hypothetical protein